jgi:hypothetical protein
VGIWHAWGTREIHTEFRVRKHKGKRPLGRPSQRWVDNIKIELKQIELKGMG